jgi:hypothetical protein
MNEVVAFLSNPVVWKAIVFYWFFSAMVGALPTPSEADSKWYQFGFRFAHGLSGNLNRAAVALKVPGSQ